MDKKKILSSLAAAGILTASVFGTNVNASTNLTSVGVYKQLISGKTVVPYILEDTNTPVKVKDVEAEFENLQLVNGTAVTDKNASLKTGDTFKANNVEYTVVVLGDADGNGKVTTNDALKAQEMVFASEGDATKKVAADVTNDKKVTTADALRIQEYVLGTNDIDVPTAEEPEEEESNYTVTVNDNGYINASNLSATQLKISLKDTFDEAKTLTVKITGTDKDSKAESVKGDDGSIEIEIPAHTDYIETSKLATPVTFDFESYNFDDGEVLIQLLDGEKIVAEVKTELNTVLPNAAQVITNRISTKEATLSLEAMGKSGITKIYYLVDGADTEKTATDFFETDGKLKDGVKVATVSNDKLVDEVVANDLTTKDAARVSYILENKYGSRSTVAYALIASDSEDVKIPKKVEEISIPEKLDKEATAVFSWEGEADTNYIATLYKDGKAITQTVVNESDTDLSVDFAANMTEAGTYKVTVYVPAGKDTKASEVTESAEVEVSKLAAVTNLEFKNEDNKVILAWSNSNDKESFKEYKIELYSIDKEGKESLAYTVSPALTSDKNEVDVTGEISDNTVYIAKVTVVKKDGQLATVNSDEVVSDKFFKVSTPDVVTGSVTENSITLEVPEMIVNGEKATYKVKIFNVNEEYTPEDALYTLKETRNVEVKDGKVVIDGLESDTPYAFKLVATVAGEEIESDYTSYDYTIPEFKNLTVVEKREDANEAGKVFVDSGKLIINDEEIDSADYDSDKLDNIVSIFSTLKAGDVVTIDGQKVILKLDNGASATEEGRDFSSLTDLKETVFEIESNKYNKNIKFADGEEVKEVILKGEGTIFNVTGAGIKKLTLTDGVEISGDMKYTVAANSTVIINGASVSTEAETVIKATAASNALTVSMNEEANDLVFENKKNTDLTITFESNEEHTTVQSGSIVIRSEGGKVTVSSNANVNADLTVEVNSGKVELIDPKLTGDKDVVVSVEEGKTSTITTLAATKAPIELDVSVDIKDEDLRKEPGVTDKNFDEVKAFINSFGLNGTGATISVDKDSNEVTITFTPEEDKTIDNVTIENLK